MGAAEVLNLDLGVAGIVDNLEGPGLNVLLDGRVIKPTADQTPVRATELALETEAARIEALVRRR